MALPKGLLIRSNGYYFQARIPKQYLAHYPKATIYEKLVVDKLPVDNRQEAIKLVHERWAKLHQEFESIDSTGSLFKSIPLALEADNLIAKALHSRMLADEELRAEGLDDFMYEELERWATEADEAERLAISRGILTPRYKAIVSDWLQGNGYESDIDSDSFKQFAIIFMKAQAQATKSIKLRATGESVDTPPAPPPLNTQVVTYVSEWDSLDKLREYWLTQPAKSGNAKKSRMAEAEAITIIKKFRKLVGNFKPSEITRSHW